MVFAALATPMFDTPTTARTLFATRADLAALEARLTWRFAGAMAAQTLTLIGAMVAVVRLIG